MRKNPGKCKLYIGSPKHGFIVLGNEIADWGPNVIFGSAEHFARYTTKPNAVSAGCRSFKYHFLIAKPGSLPK